LINQPLTKNHTAKAGLVRPAREAALSQARVNCDYIQENKRLGGRSDRSCVGQRRYPFMDIDIGEINAFAELMFDVRGQGALKYVFETCEFLLRAGERDEALNWFHIGEAIVRLERVRSMQNVANCKASLTLQ